MECHKGFERCSSSFRLIFRNLNQLFNNEHPTDAHAISLLTAAAGGIYHFRYFRDGLWHGDHHQSHDEQQKEKGMEGRGIEISKVFQQMSGIFSLSIVDTFIPWRALPLLTMDYCALGRG